jgi:hypothetical protein
MATQTQTVQDEKAEAAPEERISLTPAEYAAFTALLSRPSLPTAGVDEQGYAVVAPPREDDGGEGAAWRTPDGKTYTHWYSPEFPDITLRPHPNHVIQYRAGAYTPINAKEDDYLRDWTWRQRGKNDPELWHGDTAAFDDPTMPDLECEFCHRFSCRNHHVMAAHKAKKHKREDLAEHPFTGFSPQMIRAGRITPRHQ